MRRTALFVALAIGLSLYVGTRPIGVLDAVPGASPNPPVAPAGEATPAQVRAVSDGHRALVAVARTDSAGTVAPESGDERAPTALSIAPELARLRALEPELGYHTAAWPVVLRLAEKARASLLAAEELELVLDDRLSSSDSARVRGSALVALALGRADAQTRAGAERHLDSTSSELERAAWIALAVLAPHTGEPSALSIQRFGTSRRLLALAGGAFLGKGMLPTYPVTFEQGVFEREVALALERVTRPLPEEASVAQVDEELFTRELVVIAALGPAAGRAGAVRATLLDWIRHADLEPERHLVEAAAFVLAAAARTDDELRASLLQVAAAAPPATAAVVLTYLARSGSGAERVAAELALLVDRPLGDLGVPSREQMESMRALGELAASPADAVAAFAASGLLLERVLDPGRSTDERYALLRELAGADPDVRAYAAGEIVAWDTDPLLVAEASLQLGSAGHVDGALHRDLLITRFDQQLPLTRKAMVVALARLSGPETQDFLRSVARDDPDPDVRNYAKRWSTPAAE